MKKAKCWAEYEQLSPRGLQENSILADHLGELDYALAGLKTELIKLVELREEENHEVDGGFCCFWKRTAFGAIKQEGSLDHSP